MKFNINKKELSAITTLVYRAASNKHTIPVLSGLLITLNQEQGMTMIATDMEIAIKASTQNIEIIEEGSVLVNAHYFADLIKLLPDSLISLEFNQETSRLDIIYGRSSGFINTYRDYEYPDLPLSNIKQSFSIDQEILKDALRKTVLAAANTHFRQVFTGILFDIRESGNLNIVASDTHRLAFYNCSINQTDIKPFQFIIPIRTANELMRFLDDSKETINIGFSENNVIFYHNDFVLLSRLIEGQYPNYEQVIPKSFSSSVKLNIEVLSNTLERARIMPSDDKLKIQYAKFNFGENELLVNTFSEIMGEIEDVLEIIELEGESNINISFNTNYFLDAVKILDNESNQIVINLSGSLGPALMKSLQNENYLYVLVPLRTSN